METKYLLCWISSSVLTKRSLFLSYKNIFTFTRLGKRLLTCEGTVGLRGEDPTASCRERIRCHWPTQAPGTRRLAHPNQSEEVALLFPSSSVRRAGSQWLKTNVFPNRRAVQGRTQNSSWALTDVKSHSLFWKLSLDFCARAPQASLRWLCFLISTSEIVLSTSSADLV